MAETVETTTYRKRKRKGQALAGGRSIGVAEENATGKTRTFSQGCKTYRARQRWSGIERPQARGTEIRRGWHSLGADCLNEPNQKIDAAKGRRLAVAQNARRGRNTARDCQQNIRQVAVGG
jgi:hypothetical protein